MPAQGIESIRVPRLPFSKKNKKGDRTRALASVEALRNWAKAQAVMLYGGERQPSMPRSSLWLCWGSLHNASSHRCNAWTGWSRHGEAGLN